LRLRWIGSTRALNMWEGRLEKWRRVMHSHRMGLLLMAREQKLRRYCVELGRENGCTPGRWTTVVDHRRWMIRERRQRSSLHVWRQVRLLSVILVILMWGVCCEVDKCSLPLTGCRQLWSIPIDVRRMTVCCMLRVGRLHRRACSILDVAMCSPPLGHERFASAAIRHYRRNTVTFCEMLFHQPWAANIWFSGGRMAQVLLQNNLGVVLSVSLQFRSPVFDNLLVIVVQSNLVRVGADCIIH
jgi:hypothetical protein